VLVSKRVFVVQNRTVTVLWVVEVKTIDVERTVLVDFTMLEFVIILRTVSITRTAEPSNPRVQACNRGVSWDVGVWLSPGRVLESG